MVIGYFLAVLTAAADAAASVLMRMAARREPRERQFRLRLVLDLARSPVWLAGLGVSILSYPIGAAALGTGELAIVQPLMTLELPMTLLGGTLVFGSRLRPQDWGGVAAMTVGLAGLIAFLLPHGGDHSNVAAWVWILSSLVTATIVAAVTAAGRRTQVPDARSAYLGSACGITYGLASAYTKSMTAQFDTSGVAGVLTSWQLYASILAGTVAMWLLQNAYAAGHLAAAQPGITLLDATFAILWGILVFHEQTRTGVFVPLAVLSGLAMAAGTVIMARSPLLRRVHG